MHIQLIKLATFFTYGDDDDDTRPEFNGDVTVWTDRDRKIYAVQWWEGTPGQNSNVRRYQTVESYADAIDLCLKRTGWGGFHSEVTQGDDR